MEQFEQGDEEEGKGTHQCMVSFFGHENEMGKQPVIIPSVQKKEISSLNTWINKVLTDHLHLNQLQQESIQG
eukprot:12408216-Ditylum_brightwellii.AAC.1